MSPDAWLKSVLRDKLRNSKKSESVDARQSNGSSKSGKMHYLRPQKATIPASFSLAVPVLADLAYCANSGGLLGLNQVI